MKHPKRVALFIDGDNISGVHARDVLAIARAHGTLVFSRAYVNAGHGNGDWNKHNIDVLVTGMGGNVSDFRLSFEAVEMDVRNTHDVFIIASNDADLVHIARWLYQRGRTVVLVGTQKMGKELRSSGAEVHILTGASKAAQKAAQAASKVVKIAVAEDVPIADPDAGMLFPPAAELDEGTADVIPLPAPQSAPEAVREAPLPRVSLSLASGRPDPEAVATLVRSVLAQNGGRMLMTTFGMTMRNGYGVQSKHGGKPTWRRYFDTQTDKFQLTGPDAALVISLRPRAAHPDPETGQTQDEDKTYA